MTARRSSDIQARLADEMFEDVSGGQSDDDEDGESTETRLVWTTDKDSVNNLFDDEHDVEAPIEATYMDDAPLESEEDMPVDELDKEEDEEGEDQVDNGIEILNLDPATPIKKERRGGKAAETDVTPRTRKLAKAAKMEARARTANREAFPDDNLDASQGDIIRTVEKAKGPDKDVFADAYKRMMQDPYRQDTMLTLVGYAAPGLRGEIVTKVKSMVEPILGIPGQMKPEEIIDSVAFLLKDRVYLYGGVNVKTKSYDRGMPLGSAFFKPIVMQTCFGKGTANREAAREMIAGRCVPANMFALVGAAIENALKTWSTGIYMHIPFAEDVGRESHLRHLAILYDLQERAPKYAARQQFSLLSQILRDTGKGHILEGYLIPEPDHFKGVNFTALEASIEDEDDVE